MKKTLNVLHIMQAATNAYGMEKTVFNTILLMDPEGIKNSVLFIIEGRREYPENRVMSMTKGFGIPVKAIYSSGPLDISILGRARREIINSNADIIHCHGYKGDIIGRISSIGSGKKIMTTVHGWLSREFKERLYEFIDMQAIRFMDLILVHSQDYKRRLLKSGVRVQRVMVVSSGVDRKQISVDSTFELRKEYNLSSTEKIIGIVARLTKEKDHKTFLNAASLILKKIESVTFLVVGEGELLIELENFSKRLGIQEKVIFTGFIEKMGNIYQGIDILISASTTEGMPRNVLEAMAFSKPVIATAAGGTSEVIADGKTGFLVEIGDYRSIAEKSILLLTNPQLAERMGAAALKRVEEEFLLIRRAEKIAEAYKALKDKNE